MEHSTGSHQPNALALCKTVAHSSLVCVVCDQHPDQVPWAMFDDDQQPLGVLCFQDCDTIQSRWPFLPLIDVVARCKGGDTRLIGQIRHLTRVKLGKDAKNFLSQDVAETIGIGIRWEQPAIPMSIEEFKTQMQTRLNPETIPGISVHDMANHANSSKKTILVKDESAKPRVILWHEQRLDLTETKFDHTQQLAPQQGREIWSQVLPNTMTTSLCDLPTFGDLQAKVRAAEAATTTGLLGDTGAALLGTAAGNVHMRAIGVHAALVADTRPAAKPGGDASGLALGVCKASGGGRSRGAQAQAQPKQSEDLTVTSRGAAEPAADLPKRQGKKRKGGHEPETDQLPSVAACLLGQAKTDTRSQSQVLYKCKQQLDGKLQTKARILVFSLGLSLYLSDQCT